MLSEFFSGSLHLTFSDMFQGRYSIYSFGPETYQGFYFPDLETLFSKYSGKLSSEKYLLSPFSLFCYLLQKYLLMYNNFFRMKEAMQII